MKLNLSAKSNIFMFYSYSRLHTKAKTNVFCLRLRLPTLAEKEVIIQLGKIFIMSAKESECAWQYKNNKIERKLEVR